MDTRPDPLAPARQGHALPALLELLEDPSPTVWRGVRRELEAMGPEALPHLRKLARRGEPRERARARTLLLQHERERVARRLAGFCAGERIDLERGLLLLARFESPRGDLRPCLVALDAMAAQVTERIESMAPGLARAQELCRYLGGELGYGGSGEDYHHPDNAYLHRVLTRKRGLPLTLCALYLLVARRAGLEAALVALPGHVVLRLHAAGGQLLVDPFRFGVVLTQQDCMEYLARSGLPFRPSWFASASDEAMLARQIRNLRAAYARRGLTTEVRLLERALEVLARRRPRPSGSR